MNEKKILAKLLLKIFQSEFKVKYSIIKLNPLFPSLDTNSDIDVFVKNKNEFILELNSKIKRFDNISIIIKNINTSHTHYDIILNLNSILLIRVDIYSRMPNFQVVKVKENLFESILENSKNKYFLINTNKIKVKIPNFYLDLVIRYIEYYEFFWTGNPKDQHIEFVKNTLLTNKKKQRVFIDYINHFTQLPLDFHFKYSNQIQKYKKSVTTKYYIKKILSRFFKINL